MRWDFTIRRRLWFLVVAAILPTLLLAYCQISRCWEAYQQAQQGPEIVAVTRYLGDLTHELQKERGMSAGFIAGGGTTFVDELKKQRQETDAVLQRIDSGLQEAVAAGLINAAAMQEIRQRQSRIVTARTNVDALQEAGPILKEYTSFIQANFDLAIACARTTHDGRLVQTLLAAEMLAMAKEYAGLERANVSQALAGKQADAALRRKIADLQRAQEEHLLHFESLVPLEVLSMLSDAQKASHTLRAAEIAALVTNAMDGDHFDIEPNEWWKVQTARLGDYRQIQLVLAEEIKAQAAQTASQELRRLIGAVVICGLAILFVGGIGFQTARTIAKRTKRLTSSIRKIATGEASLQERLPCMEGELGEIAASFNQVLERLDKAGELCSSSSSSLASSGEELSRNAESVKRDITQSQNQSEEITRDVASMFESIRGASGSISSVSDSLQSASQSIQRLVDDMEKASKQANQASQTTQSAAEIVSQNSAQIERLESAAAEIGDVVQLIRDIADQTQLLSLNATIEASRAGEAGRGFAVVATEVKQLALQTSSAIEGIENRIAAIQSATSATTKSTTQVSDLFQKILNATELLTEVTQEQGRAATALSEEVGRVVESSQSARGNMDTTVDQTQAINQRLKSIDQLLNTAVVGMGQAYDASHDLSELASTMKEQMNMMLCRHN
ncbi:methyl-accepting chemotaxis protein [Bremerella cremea]|uniref:Methyl-accepting chemotaxis protein n=1 Tax=Bremerella cremea TaxID=1031537 RepID=A0A368KK87_9BACT|nr:nitrate- and nitrite sensing domain-containing protein [Bremerella cremea]RCS41177.1 methyl-accepting chemotaxis protein [Bremerella cremea]